MTDKAWKAFERALARDIGTERVPVNGRHAVDGDFETSLFVFQAKHRRHEFPVTVARWVERIRAAAAARRPPKIGVVVIQRPRGRRSEALVVLTWSDWLALHGNRVIGVDLATGDDRTVHLTEKAVQHIETGCPLPAGHSEPCLPQPMSVRDPEDVE